MQCQCCSSHVLLFDHGQKSRGEKKSRMRVWLNWTRCSDTLDTPLRCFPGDFKHSGGWEIGGIGISDWAVVLLWALPSECNQRFKRRQTVPLQPKHSFQFCYWGERLSHLGFVSDSNGSLIAFPQWNVFKGLNEDKLRQCSQNTSN